VCVCVCVCARGCVSVCVCGCVVRGCVAVMGERSTDRSCLCERLYGVCVCVCESVQLCFRSTVRLLLCVCLSGVVCVCLCSCVHRCAPLWFVFVCGLCTLLWLDLLLNWVFIET